MFKGTSSAMQFEFRGQEALSRKVVIAAILGVALLAFEIFNFDTTQFALGNLLGEIRFAGVMWATILAIAFCAIDFAGLVRIITPQKGEEEPRAVWFLTGAWFLGTIANSVLTWWAVSVSLLSHEFGNEVLSREALLRYVPIFVAMLVWLTRILFIGAFSVAGENVFALARDRSNDERPRPMPVHDVTSALPARAEPVRQPVVQQSPRPATRTAATTSQPRANRTNTNRPAATPNRPAVTYEPVDDPFDEIPATPKTNGANVSRPTSRIQQRPPMPGMRRPSNIQARPSNNRQ